MASTFLQRLIGVAPIEAKAETGSGLFALQGYPQLSSLSRRPEKLIAEAEALFHSNVWVAACERAVVGRFASVQFHLEDPEDNTLDADSSPLAASLLQVLNRPSAHRSRRQLWSLTGRHLGLTGNAFWYLSQRDLLGGTPLECLYINPARMTPVEDGGDNLLGWIMDHPQNPMTKAGTPATPFTPEEIIHFVLNEPDWGHYGIGIAETAQSKIELSRLTDRHGSMVIASGGRLAGIISPKAGASISDDGWQAVIRDYRNILGDPESAKRLQVMRSPVDFTKTTADPTELQLTGLATMARDDILAAWAVPQSQLGIIPTRGLNSGETPKFEEAQMWQGAVNDRLAPFVEKLQGELIDRWAAHGLVAEIELETPTFDDQAPLFDNALKANTVPLTNNERRAMVGLDPFADDQFGSEVYLASTMARIDPLNMAPEPQTAAAPLPAVDIQQLTQPDMVPGKATALETLRHRTEISWEPRIRAKVSEVLHAQRTEVAARIAAKHAHLVSKPTDVRVWWNTEAERQRLQLALEPLVLAMAAEVARRAEDKFPARVRPSGKAVDAGYIDRMSNVLRSHIGVRIVGITDTTRDKVAAAVERGISEGLSPTELAALIEADAIFDEARAEMISRTETMLAYNEAALSTYTELGAQYVDAIDGDGDEACAERVRNNPWLIDDAYSENDHPNGTLDWIPVVAEEVKAAPPYWAALVREIAKAAAVPKETAVPIDEDSVVPVTLDNSEVAKALLQLRDTVQRKHSEVSKELSQLRGFVHRKSVVTKTVQRDPTGRIVAVIEKTQ